MSEITDKDKEILGMVVEGYGFVQVTLSRITGNMMGGEQRETLVSRHLPLEAVRQYINTQRQGESAYE